MIVAVLAVFTALFEERNIIYGFVKNTYCIQAKKNYKYSVRNRWALCMFAIKYPKGFKFSVLVWSPCYFLIISVISSLSG